jgi:hypothetical protein
MLIINNVTLDITQNKYTIAVAISYLESLAGKTKLNPTFGHFRNLHCKNCKEMALERSTAT